MRIEALQATTVGTITLVLHFVYLCVAQSGQSVRPGSGRFRWFESSHTDQFAGPYHKWTMDPAHNWGYVGPYPTGPTPIDTAVGSLYGPRMIYATTDKVAFNCPVCSMRAEGVRGDGVIKVSAHNREIRRVFPRGFGSRCRAVGISCLFSGHWFNPVDLDLGLLDMDSIVEVQVGCQKGCDSKVVSLELRDLGKYDPTAHLCMWRITPRLFKVPPGKMWQVEPMKAPAGDIFYLDFMYPSS